MKTGIILDAYPSPAAPAWARLKAQTRLLVTFALLLLSAPAVPAQETSRQIPFTNLATTLPQRSTQSLTAQLQDAAGAVVFAEAHPEVAVDNKGRISFVFGALTGEGLNPEHFPAGSSRFLDVVDASGASVLEGGRLALTAAVFSLSPGPRGPAGPAGPQGPAGPAPAITAGDGSIVIGGTPSAPTVAVAPGGINNTKVADGALSPGKIAGTAATLGAANVFNNSQTVNGTLDVTGAVNTGSQYQIGGSRVLSVPGAANTFAGVGAGQANTTGSQNSFFGSGAGQANNGAANSFFGMDAGLSNTGNFNSFFGRFAGRANTSGGDNAFYGATAGVANTTGLNNSFFGRLAGTANTTGSNNSFFGNRAGFGITTESLNTFLGFAATGAPGVSNATAVGANAAVTQSDSLVLGNNVSVGVGTSAPRARLHVQGGHILVGSPGQGIILKSPNGAVCRVLTVNDAGTLISTATVCPN